MAPKRRSRSRRRARQRLIRRGLLTALVVVCALFLATGWIVLRGTEARGNLISAANMADQLSQQLRAGDSADARRTLAALQEQTSAAHRTTTGPVWWTGSHAPIGGADISAIRDIAACVDDLAWHTFPQLIDLNLASLVPSAGHLDLASLRMAAPALAGAHADTAAVQARIDAVDTDGLLGPVRNAVVQLRAQITLLSTLTTEAWRGSALLPALLGADGPRTYLLLLQNLAESRSTGGMFGAYAILRADGGRVTLTGHGAGGDLGTFAHPVLPIDPSSRALFSYRPGMFPADVNLTPDFPTAATSFREMYRRRTGVTVDGVLATDPVALSYLLAAVGPVALPSGPTLTSANAVSTLLSGSYATIASATGRHDYFGASLITVFDAVLHRSLKPGPLLAALGRACEERRLLFWSSHPADESALAGTQLSGVLPNTETVPTVGVFLNDGSGSKLDYYLTHAATLSVGGCRTDGRRALDLEVDLGSTAPASGLTDGVLGLKLGPTPYTARVVVYLFSPAHGALVHVDLDGKPEAVASGAQSSRQVGVVTVDVGPGQHHILHVSLLTPVTPLGTARLWLTPGVAPWTGRTHSAPVCA